MNRYERNKLTTIRVIETLTKSRMSSYWDGGAKASLEGSAPVRASEARRRRRISCVSVGRKPLAARYMREFGHSSLISKNVFHILSLLRQALNELWEAYCG